MRTTTGVCPNERGQSLVWVAGVILLVGSLCVLTGRLGATARISARADAVADLTALAGAVGGESAAAEVAAANGGHLIEFRAGDSVDVVVTVAGRRGVAAARAVAGDAIEGP